MDRRYKTVAMLLAFASPVVMVGSASCGSDSAGAGVGGAGSGTANGGAGTAGAYSSGVGPVPDHQAPCGNKLYECGDLADNDSDGLIDSQDPDCLGPCDNTEDGYYPDLPGLTGDPCRVDCFWDQGNGPSDDCHWDHRCDPLEVAPNYPPEGIDCAYDPNFLAGPYTCTEALAAQSQACLDYCAPLTPNGCDCFGCCNLPAGSNQFVWLGSADADKNGTCTIAVVNDPALCEPCTPVPGCLNGCDPCELCIGKTTLPPECFDPDGGNSEQCAEGYQPCGLPGQDNCPVNYYCITGCCVEVPQ